MAGWAATLGLTLVHFVWQGAVVALLLMAALVALRRRGPEVRYLACCVALVALVLFPLATLARLAGAYPATGGTLGHALTDSLPATGPLVPLLPWIATLWLGTD